MKKFMVLLLFAFSFTGAAAAPQKAVEQTWDELRSEDGNFLIWLPGKAQHSSENNTDKEPFEVHMYLCTNGDMRYLIGYGDYSDAARKQNTDDELMDAEQKAMLEAFKGKVDSQKKSTTSGRAARITTFSSETLAGELRSVVNKKRCYMVVSASKKETYDKASAAKVLDSFKILDENQ